MKQTVLILENDNGIKSFLEECLKHDYRVEIISNGCSLLDWTGHWPDLFIIDVSLDGINGLEMCKWIKSNEDVQHIPVLLYSGSPELEVLANNVYCDGYLAMPFTTEALLEKVTAVLTHKLKENLTY